MRKTWVITDKSITREDFDSLPHPSGVGSIRYAHAPNSVILGGGHHAGPMTVSMGQGPSKVTYDDHYSDPKEWQIQRQLKEFAPAWHAIDADRLRRRSKALNRLNKLLEEFPDDEFRAVRIQPGEAGQK